MAKKKTTQEPTTQVAKTTPTQSTFNYSPIPSSVRLTEVISRIPSLPQNWADMPQFDVALREWHEQLQQAAHMLAAANDATGLMAEIIDGKRKIDDEATRIIAMVTAIRA